MVIVRLLSHQNRGLPISPGLVAKATSASHCGTMVHSSAASGEGNESSESGEAAGEVRLSLDGVDVDDGDSAESVIPESAQLRRSPRSMLASSLRAHRARVVCW